MPMNNNTYEEFLQLKDQLKDVPLDEIMDFEGYIKIIGMGKDALPFILTEIKNNLHCKDLWSLALYYITREHITTDWLSWGYENGFIVREVIYPRPGEYWMDHGGNVWLLSENDDFQYPLQGNDETRSWTCNGHYNHDKHTDSSDLVRQVTIC